ncbi:Rieske domain-containing protein-like isoform X3 [Salmo trutta]|uniref:Rieske domain-containing protein-like isoform X3 n=1 Tax=Salmo trutta TaxID=8032 RepID=UPI0011312640|nr:Rieske domain-containing protein-like isoform X3 [Salmo trutta]
MGRALHFGQFGDKGSFPSSVWNISISMEEREERQEPATGSHFVGKKEDLIKAKRSFRTVEGRDILVLCHQEIFYALDFHCYHAGGPLQNGDIEFAPLFMHLGWKQGI